MTTPDRLTVEDIQWIADNGDKDSVTTDIAKQFIDTMRENLQLRKFIGAAPDASLEPSPMSTCKHPNKDSSHAD